mmetsp:Transcript_64314/g.158266  ORF Transcript_64314/g.158266 Transcript_64314/m.158266 type:complete len:205 (-) Transcript_64314:1-615(-)
MLAERELPEPQIVPHQHLVPILEHACRCAKGLIALLQGPREAVDIMASLVPVVPPVALDRLGVSLKEEATNKHRLRACFVDTNNCLSNMVRVLEWNHHRHSGTHGRVAENVAAHIGRCLGAVEGHAVADVPRPLPVEVRHRTSLGVCVCACVLVVGPRPLFAPWKLGGGGEEARACVCGPASRPLSAPPRCLQDSYALHVHCTA